MMLECVWGDYYEQSEVSQSNYPCRTPESVLEYTLVFFLESGQGYENMIELPPSSDDEPTLPLLCPGILPDSSPHMNVPLSFHLDIAAAGNYWHSHMAAVVAESKMPGDCHSLREVEWQSATAECKGCCPQLEIHVLKTWGMGLLSAAEECGSD